MKLHQESVLQPIGLKPLGNAQVERCDVRLDRFEQAQLHCQEEAMLLNAPVERQDQYRRACGATGPWRDPPSPGLSGILCRGRFDIHARNLSSNMIANWIFAWLHSFGGIFHSPAA